jgi:hypothetical protein
MRDRVPMTKLREEALSPVLRLSFEDTVKRAIKISHLDRFSKFSFFSFLCVLVGLCGS